MRNGVEQSVIELALCFPVGLQKAFHICKMEQFFSFCRQRYKSISNIEVCFVTCTPSVFLSVFLFKTFISKREKNLSHNQCNTNGQGLLFLGLHYINVFAYVKC